MKKSDPENFIKKSILPHFPLAEDEVQWQDDSELDIDSHVYYFSISHENYLLVQKDAQSTDSRLDGNAIAPHETAVAILPKNSQYNDVYISEPPALSGYFSLFKIQSRSR